MPHLARDGGGGGQHAAVQLRVGGRAEREEDGLRKHPRDNGVAVAEEGGWGGDDEEREDPGRQLEPQPV